MDQEFHGKGKDDWAALLVPTPPPTSVLEAPWDRAESQVLMQQRRERKEKELKS